MRQQRLAVRSLMSVVALAMLASPAPAQLMPPKPAAVVDGTAITMAELEALLKQAGPTAAPLTEAQRRQVQRDALEMLISDLLFQETMRQTGRRVAVAEVEKEMTELAQGLVKQGKNLADFLKESSMDEAELRSRIVTRLQWESYVHDRFTEADIRKYYDDNRDFFDCVAVRASHIVIRVAPDVPESERQAARARLQALRQDLLAGKIDFAEAARKYSQDTSAANGGDIGYFPRKLRVDEVYARTAFALKVGEISNVIQTELGMYLIKVTDRKPGTPSDYNQIKEDVRKLCTEETMSNLIAQRRKTARIVINIP